MDSQERPQGKRFTEVYRERGPRAEDSARFRRRLAHKLVELVDWDTVQTLRAETGHLISNQSSPKWWIDFIGSLPIDELLDLITQSIHAFIINAQMDSAAEFAEFARRALDEENVSFELDGRGGVHYRVDRAFQSGRRAALEALEGSDAIAAREAFEEAHLSLTRQPSDTLAAVRRAFDAVENLFKMRHGTSRLGAAEIKAKMKDAGSNDGKRAHDAARRMNEAFSEWVNACHQYRHAPGEPDPSPPPRWLATALVDGASTYIRYLSAID